MQATALQTQAYKRVHELLAQARELYPNANIPTVAVRFTVRGTCAGKANYMHRYVNFNPVLLEENGQAFIDRTVVHEVAHIVTDAVHWRPTRAHGKEWRSVMRKLGVSEPTRCHSYDVSNARVRTVRRFTYKCGCASHELTTVRHNKILRGYGYTCQNCGQALTRA